MIADRCIDDGRTRCIHRGIPHVACERQPLGTEEEASVFVELTNALDALLDELVLRDLFLVSPSRVRSYKAVAYRAEILNARRSA